MRKDKTLRELLQELHYWQMRVRLDIRSLERSKAKCKELAAKMRARQAWIKQNRK